jgi:MHS family proline/betaine transporter-like MFS transporter
VANDERRRTKPTSTDSAVENGEQAFAEEDITVIDPALRRRAVAAAAVGNAVEWFDFGVFSYLAVTIGIVFFPSPDPSAQLLATFATFSGAFVVRPIGGVIFGALGDRVGRQRILAITMLLMAAATFSIGLIPSAVTIGPVAGILLLVARLLQGFSTGGEYGGATTFVVEHSPDRRRGGLASWLEVGTLSGFVLGSGMVTLLTAILSPEAFLSYGWRIPFLLAGPLGVIGLYLRLKLEDTPTFSAQSESGGEEEMSAGQQLKETVVGQGGPMLLCMGLVIVFNVTDYLLLSYMPTYLTANLGFPETSGLLILLVVMVLLTGATLGIGRLSDRVGRRPIILAGCIGFLLLSVPAVLVIQLGTITAIFGGVLVLGLLLTCFTGTMPGTLPALFPTRVRYAGVSIGFNVSVSIFGGTAPLAVTALITATGDTLMLGYYLMAASLIGLISALLLRETAGRRLSGSSPAVESQAEARELATA